MTRVRLLLLPVLLLGLVLSSGFAATIRIVPPKPDHTHKPNTCSGCRCRRRCGPVCFPVRSDL